MSRAAFVATVLGYCGTPYAAHQRTPGVGMDCPGPLILAARAHGLVAPDFDVNGYSLDPDGKTLRAHLDAHLERIGPDELQPADVVLAAYREELPRHLGIVTKILPDGRRYWVEAESVKFKRVVELRLVVHTRAMRIAQAYRIPGIDTP